MAGLERRLFVRSVAIGLLVTAAVLTANSLGFLTSVEDWLYDQRAIYCQIHTKAPSTQISHLDIDDESLDAIGRWPWPRATLARILDEVQRAKPAALGLDILFSEPQKPRLELNSQGHPYTIDDDAELANAMRIHPNTVMAASFKINAPDAESPAQAKAREWLNADLELSPEQFNKRLYENKFPPMEDAQLNDLFLRGRRQAMKERIDQALTNGLVPRDQLMAHLLPHTSPDIQSPLTNLFADQYALSSAAVAVYRFSTPSQTFSLMPVQGTFSALPCPKFSDDAAECGFVDYDIFGSATIRSVPMFVEFNHHLYPQMGLATACVMLGADLSSVRFEGSNIVIPARNQTISIPTYTFHSKTQGRDVPLIAAIPWFGTTQWETMYDWPAHKNNTAHNSIASVWDICHAQDSIIKNNANIDDAISYILDDDQGYKLAIDPELGRKYSKNPPDPADTVAREAMVARTADAAKDVIQTFKSLPDSKLSESERLQRDNLYHNTSVLTQLVDQNGKLVKQIESQRHQLALQVAGKAVFIGFTGAGFDQVTTSLHARVPGVIVHGVIANAVLTGSWWHMAPPWITSLLIFILGLLSAAALGWLSPLRGSAVALALLVAYALINGLLVFGLGKWIVGLAGPMTAIIAVWAFVTLYRLITETLERYRIATEVAVINREMELAREVQVALIPAEPPNMEGLESHGWALPASQTGGDCYDLWKLEDGRLAVLVADASGHGLAPAMIVSQVRTLLRALCDMEKHPHGLLERVNRRVANDLEASRFVTAFLGFISPDGKLDWASAGHGPMYWCPAGGAEILELDSTGMPLGIQADWIADDPTPPLQLNGSGMLVVFSDGINESRSPSGEMFGVERVKDILSKSDGKTSAQIVEALKSAVQTFQQKTEPIDDQTIVVVRKIGKPQAA